MRVAVLGAGGIGLGYAAFLATRGHEPIVWSRATSQASSAPLMASGALAAEVPLHFAATPADAVSGAEAAIVAVPGNAHRAVLDAVLPHLPQDTSLILSAHLSFAALYAGERRAARGDSGRVIAWSTTALMGRKTGPHSVEIGGLRHLVDMASLPGTQAQESLALCVALFGDRFRLCDDLLSIQLGNLNPPIHMATALCNLTRIERGEAWSNYDGITPSVARLIEALDRERLTLANHFGVAARTVEEHYRLTFGFPPGQSLAAMAAEVHRRRNGPPGPKSLDTRFVLEDVPFGLVPLVRVATSAGLSLPLHEAGIRLFGALYGRDFAADNDLVDDVTLPKSAAP